MTSRILATLACLIFSSMAFADLYSEDQDFGGDQFQSPQSDDLGRTNEHWKTDEEEKCKKKQTASDINQCLEDVALACELSCETDPANPTTLDQDLCKSSCKTDLELASVSEEDHVADADDADAHQSDSTEEAETPDDEALISE